MSLNRYSLTLEEKEAIIKIIKAYLANIPSIKFAYLHGSFLGDLPSRDIDIAIYFDPALTPDDQLDLSLTISSELSFKLRLPVDAHVLNETSLAFAYGVTKGIVIISRDEPARLEFLENTWINYFDFEPLLREALIDLLQV
ncbi:nucleotidyltransferase domain-containing protein [Moorella naiadis]|uniref:nucleotidyltransferase domain-containing protein n=1 Tax=Moorella naiadis (nom. illeg.) TaxID=3093670 RepID=UPI003D9C8551